MSLMGYVYAKLLSRVQLYATPWTVAFQAPLSMGLSRQEYWCGLPFPSPGDLPDPGIDPVSWQDQPGSLPMSHQGSQKVFILNTKYKSSRQLLIKCDTNTSYLFRELSTSESLFFPSSHRQSLKELELGERYPAM